jgi:mitogen-activated protein kinase 1/3
MSRGGYTAAIDVWSAGCIFGELLQRLSRVGSATTPHLQVAPLFAIHGVPKTPDAGWAAVPSRMQPACMILHLLHDSLC